VYIGVGHFVSEYQMSGSSQGKGFTCDGVDVIAVADGRIARKDTYLDWTCGCRKLGSTARTEFPAPTRISPQLRRCAHASSSASESGLLRLATLEISPAGRGQAAWRAPPAGLFRVERVGFPPNRLLATPA
jgi:hypothetical protein